MREFIPHILFAAMGLWFFLIWLSRSEKEETAARPESGSSATRVTRNGVPVMGEEVSPELQTIRRGLVAHVERMNVLIRELKIGTIADRRNAAERLEIALKDVDTFCAANPAAEVTNIDAVRRLAYIEKCRNVPRYTTSRDDTYFICLIDTETTGIGAADEPISVAALLVEVTDRLGEHVREVGRYVGYREPSVEISEKAYQVHGISLSEVEGKSFDLESLYRLTESADVLVAHNADFDCRMLSVVMPGIAERPWACSMDDLRWAWSELTGGRKGLDYICSKLGIEKAKKHDAMGDVEALYKVLQTRTGKTNRSRTLLQPLIKKAVREYGLEDV